MGVRQQSLPVTGLRTTRHTCEACAEVCVCVCGVMVTTHTQIPIVCGIIKVGMFRVDSSETTQE